METSNSKMFVVVRADLPAGAQAAQACHALVAFGIAHPELVRAWHDDSNNLVVLAAPDRAGLEQVYDRAACERGVAVTRFHEPDFDGALTAVALHGSTAHKLVSSLPLALRPARLASAAA